METENKYLLHLLGAFLREEPPEASDTVDWQKLLRLAQIHSVTGILGYMGKKYPICGDPQVQSQLRSLCLNSIAVFARRNAMADAMVTELEKAGIDHILMKGYVLRDFYPVPELRSFNDIDIVIRQSDRKRCDERMMALGFQRHTDWEPVYSYVRGNELYEIHTDIMEIDVSDRADYRGYFRNMWDHVQPVSAHGFRFTPEYHFLYLLTHIAKHVHGSGAGIRMYLDVAAFIQHYGSALDWTWIRTQLKDLELEGFADTVLTAAEQWFGVAAPFPHRIINDDVMAEFQSFTLEAGVFGHHNRDTAVTELKHTDQAAPAFRLRHIINEAFPKAETIQKRYTYLQDKPWLLPAAWVHRLVKNRNKFGRRVQEMQDVLDADTREVLRMQKLMRDIGL